MSGLQKVGRLKKVFIILIMSCLLSLTVISCGNSELSEKKIIQRAKEYSESRKLVAAELELKNILVSNPQHAEARYLLGKIKQEQGDAVTSEKETRRGLSAGWDEAASMRQLAEAMLRQGKFDEILKEIRVKDKYPKEIQAELLGLRAAAYSGLDKWQDAAEELKAGEQVFPDARWLFQSKARLAIYKKDKPMLIATMAKALSVYPEDKDLLLLSAAIAIEDKDDAAALQALQKVIALEPKRITLWGRRAHLAMAQIYFKRKNMVSAKASIKEILRVYANDPETNYLGALLAYSEQAYDLAEKRLNTVLRFQPKHQGALLLLGRLNYQRKDYQQAAHFLEQVTSTQPKNKFAQALLGKTYMMLGQYDDAERKLSSIITDAAGDAQLLALVGVVKMKSGDASTGVEEMKKALAKNPADKRIRSVLVNAYLASGHARKAVRLLEEVVNKGDSNQQVKAKLIYGYMRIGEFEKAHALADELIRSRPDEARPYNLKAAINEIQGKLDATVENYEKALSIQANNKQAQLGMARIEQRQGNGSKAEQRYRLILKSIPDDAVTLVALAKLQAKNGHVEDALATLNRARENNPSVLEARLILSGFYLFKGDMEKALMIAKEAQSIAPDSPGATLAVARAEMSSDTKEALRLLNNLVRYSPDYVGARFYLAQARAITGDTEGTRQALKATLKLQPDFIKARLALAEMDVKAGKPDAALEAVAGILQKQPKNAEAFILQGDALLRKRDLQAAMNAYEKAAKFSGKEIVVLRIAKLYQMQGKIEEAISALGQWLHTHGNHFAVRFKLANLYMLKGDNDAAYKEYVQMNDKFPENAAVLNDLAWLKLLRGEEDALSLAKRASRLAPDNAAVQDTYGWILLKTGRAESALIVLNQASDMLPESPYIRYHYAVALVETGDKEKARKILDEILKTGTAFSEIEEVRKLRDQL